MQMKTLISLIIMKRYEMRWIVLYASHGESDLKGKYSLFSFKRLMRNVKLLDHLRDKIALAIQVQEVSYDEKKLTKS